MLVNGLRTFLINAPTTEDENFFENFSPSLESVDEFTFSNHVENLVIN